MIRVCQITFFFLLTSTFSSLAYAGFSLPNHVYTGGEIEMAQGHADSINVPLAFVYSNKGFRNPNYSSY